jgi:hypothetical protein
MQQNKKKILKGCCCMLKSEFIQNELKQNNISKNAEKTMQRLRAIWKPLKKPQRTEILELVGLKQTAIERAYKTGNISAKIVSAVSQVLRIDPLYIAGISDDERPFDDSLVVEFLKDLGYEVEKSNLERKKRTPREARETPINTTAAVEPKNDVAEDAAVVAPMQSSVSSIADCSGNFNDLPAILAGLSKIFGGNVQDKLQEVTEEDISLMLKSLSIQAGFSDDKKNRLALIKCLLLL